MVNPALWIPLAQTMKGKREMQNNVRAKQIKVKLIDFNLTAHDKIVVRILLLIF